MWKGNGRQDFVQFSIPPLILYLFVVCGTPLPSSVCDILLCSAVLLLLFYVLFLSRDPSIGDVGSFLVGLPILKGMQFIGIQVAWHSERVSLHHMLPAASA